MMVGEPRPRDKERWRERERYLREDSSGSSRAYGSPPMDDA